MISPMTYSASTGRMIQILQLFNNSNQVIVNVSGHGWAGSARGNGWHGRTRRQAARDIFPAAARARRLAPHVGRAGGQGSRPHPRVAADRRRWRAGRRLRRWRRRRRARVRLGQRGRRRAGHAAAAQQLGLAQLMCQVRNVGRLFLHLLLQPLQPLLLKTTKRGGTRRRRRRRKRRRMRTRRRKKRRKKKKNENMRLASRLLALFPPRVKHVCVYFFWRRDQLDTSL